MGSGPNYNGETMTETAQILDGRAVAVRLIANVATAVNQHLAEGGRKPALAVILVGDDPASEIYVNNKVRACEQAGIESVDHRLPHGTGRGVLLALIEDRNSTRLNSSHVALSYTDIA